MGSRCQSTVGALIMTCTMLGVPYYKYGIIYLQNPIPTIKAPILRRWRCLRCSVLFREGWATAAAAIMSAQVLSVQSSTYARSWPKNASGQGQCHTPQGHQPFSRIAPYALYCQMRGNMFSSSTASSVCRPQPTTNLITLHGLHRNSWPPGTTIVRLCQHRYHLPPWWW